MKRKMFLLLGIFLALTITGVSYASTQATKSVTIEKGDFASIEEAGTAKGPSTEDFSDWSPAEGISGTTGSGDLYMITPNGSTGDIFGTLYLSNAAELSNSYNYLNLNVNIYGTNDDGTTWTDINKEDTDGDGTAETTTTTVLSLTNGYITFSLSGGYEKYAISVDGGSYYCISADTQSVLSPEFYVEIN